jgi:hypothetical protein
MAFMAVVRRRLDELREVYAIPKAVTDGIRVRSEAIGTDLKSL